MRALESAKSITLGEAREGDCAIKTGGWGGRGPFGREIKAAQRVLMYREGMAVSNLLLWKRDPFNTCWCGRDRGYVCMCDAEMVQGEDPSSCVFLR